MSNVRVHSVRIEIWSAKNVEVFQESSVRGRANKMTLRLGYALINAGADTFAPTQRACQPTELRFCEQACRELHPKVNSASRQKEINPCKTPGASDCGAGQSSPIVEFGSWAISLTSHFVIAKVLSRGSESRLCRLH